MPEKHSFSVTSRPEWDGEGGIVWDVMGQVYKPVQLSKTSFAFDTLFPSGSVALTFLATTCSGQTMISHTTTCMLIAEF